MAVEGGSPLDLPNTPFPWAVTALFLIFMGIIVVFEICIGLLAWLSEAWLHLKQVVVERLKAELLALGVVSLVLAFITPLLTKVCVPLPESQLDYMNESPTPRETSSKCPANSDLLFPSDVVSASHFLLFWISVVEICYTLITVILTAFRFRRIGLLEQVARSNRERRRRPTRKASAANLTNPGQLVLKRLDTNSIGIFKPLPDMDRASVGVTGLKTIVGIESAGFKGSGFKGRMAWWWGCMLGGIRQREYSALRMILHLRIKVDNEAAVPLRMINLAIASEQMIQRDAGKVHAHTWLSVVSIALLLLYNEVSFQIIWINVVSLVVLVIVTTKIYVSTQKLVGMLEADQASRPGELAHALSMTHAAVAAEFFQETYNRTSAPDAGDVSVGGELASATNSLRHLSTNGTVPGKFVVDVATLIAGGAGGVMTCNPTFMRYTAIKEDGVSDFPEEAGQAAKRSANLHRLSVPILRSHRIQKASFHQQSSFAGGSVVVPDQVGNLPPPPLPPPPPALPPPGPPPPSPAPSPAASALSQPQLAVTSVALSEAQPASVSRAQPAALFPTPALTAPPHVSLPPVPPTVVSPPLTGAFATPAAAAALAASLHDPTPMPTNTPTDTRTDAPTDTSENIASVTFPPCPALTHQEYSLAFPPMRRLRESSDDAPEEGHAGGGLAGFRAGSKSVRHALQSVFSFGGKRSSLDGAPGPPRALKSFMHRLQLAVIPSSQLMDLESGEAGSPEKLSEIEDSAPPTPKKFIPPILMDRFSSGPVSDHVDLKSDIDSDSNVLTKLMSAALDHHTMVEIDPKLAKEVAEFQDKALGLFWLRSPVILLWLAELVSIGQSAICCIAIFFLSAANSADVSNVRYLNDVAVWVPILLWSLFTAVYIGWVTIPQYALVTTALVTPPHALVHHLKWSRVVHEEQEEGLAGVVCGLLDRVHNTRALYLKRKRIAHKYARAAHRVKAPASAANTVVNGAAQKRPQMIAAADGGAGGGPVDLIRNSTAGLVRGLSRLSRISKSSRVSVERGTDGGKLELALDNRDSLGQEVVAEVVHKDHLPPALAALADAWVVSLAVRAGVVLEAHAVAAAQMQLERHSPLFLGLAVVWRHKAQVARGLAQEPAEGYAVAGGVWLATFKKMFEALDVTEGGTISASELQEHVRGSLNLRLSKAELRAMMGEVMLAGNGSALPPSEDPPSPERVTARALLAKVGAVVGTAPTKLNKPTGIDFHGFVIFAAFAFFDSSRKGRLTMAGMRFSLAMLGMQVPDIELHAMLSLAAHDQSHQVGSVRFLQLLDDLTLLD